MDAGICKREFPQPDDLIYLNHAAVSPWPARTGAAVADFAEENVRTGASRYSEWLARESDLKQRLARFVNAPSADDIALLKNTSEALSVVAAGVDWRWGDNVVTADEEFPSNRIPWEAQRKWGVALREVSLGGADAEADLIDACDDRTRLLSISSVQYASGRRLDVARLGRLCRERGILFCVDAIQSLGALELDVQAACADFVMADAHKWLLGPEGIAVFYCAGHVRRQLELRQFGWHMVENAGDFDERDWRPAAGARRFEPGSVNMLGIHALSASLSLFEEIGMAAVAERVLENGTLLFDGLRELAGVEMLTPAEPAARAGIVSFRAAGDPAALHRQLLDRNVLCACRGGGIRLSPHFYLPREKILKTVEIIDSII